MPRIGAGEDRGVVGERDRGQRRHRAVAESGAHVDEPANVRRLAPHRDSRRARWRSRRRTGSRRRARAAASRSSIRSRSAARRPAGPGTRHWRRGRSSPRPAIGRRAHELQHRGCDVDQLAAAIDDALLLTPAPATMNGARACTTSIEPCSPRWPPWSSQLWAAVWIAIEVGRGRGVEQLRRLLVGERIGVGLRGPGTGWPARRRAARTGRSTGRPGGCAPRPARRRTPIRPPVSVRRNRTRPSTDAAS